MPTSIHQPHDKYFKRNLKDKKIAIDFLKSYLSSELYEKIDISSLELAEKSFILPQLREIHSDIIYKCQINNTPGYLFFLLEHQSTADPLMAFRFLHTIVSLCYEHLKQGHTKLPIILPFCMYHGETSPYPYSTSIFDCFENPEFAKKVMFKPFKLIDLTVFSDEEIKTHGLLGLMEMLFKHQRDNNFLAVMRELLQSHFVQNIINRLDISHFMDMLNYIHHTGQDLTEPNAVGHLIEELKEAFPEEAKRKTIMTFAEQMKESHYEEFMNTLAPQLENQGLKKGREEGLKKGLKKGREEGREEVRYEMAMNLLAEGMNLDLVKKITKLLNLDLSEERV